MKGRKTVWQLVKQSWWCLEWRGRETPIVFEDAKTISKKCNLSLDKH